MRSGELIMCGAFGNQVVGVVEPRKENEHHISHQSYHLYGIEPFFPNQEPSEYLNNYSNHKSMFIWGKIDVEGTTLSMSMQIGEQKSEPTYTIEKFEL